VPWMMWRATCARPYPTAKVSAFVTHGVFPKNSWKRFTVSGAGGQGFSNFWITAGRPLVHFSAKPELFM